MSINQFVALIALLAACVYAAGFSLAWGIGRSQQMEPSRNPVRLGNDLFATSLGTQRDLFGTPFGPPFSIQTGAKYANLPDFRRNFVDRTQVCNKRMLFPKNGFGNERQPIAPRRWEMLVVGPAAYKMRGLSDAGYVAAIGQQFSNAKRYGSDTQSIRFRSAAFHAGRRGAHVSASAVARTGHGKS